MNKAMPLGPISPEKMRGQLRHLVERAGVGPALILGRMAELADIVQFAPALGGSGGDWRQRFDGHLQAIERAIEQLNFRDGEAGVSAEVWMD